MDWPRDAPQIEAEFHILTGGDDTFALLLPLLQNAQREKVKYVTPNKTLTQLLLIWPTTAPYEELRWRITWHTKNIAETFCTGRSAQPIQ